MQMWTHGEMQMRIALHCAAWFRLLLLVHYMYFIDYVATIVSVTPFPSSFQNLSELHAYGSTKIESKSAKFPLVTFNQIILSTTEK